MKPRCLPRQIKPETAATDVRSFIGYDPAESAEQLVELRWLDWFE